MLPGLTIQERLAALLPKLQDTRLLSNRGIGNEIGFYIFDYNAEYEPLVQQHIDRLKVQLTSLPNPLIVLEINLYKIILDILKQRGLLEKAFDLEEKKGNRVLAKTITPIIQPDPVISYIQNQLQGNEQLVLMTGVGASWPLLRSHTVLNNLHPILDKIPLVMFFPGEYDGHELRLFNNFKDDNYYRAFPLIPHNSTVL